MASTIADLASPRPWCSFGRCPAAFFKLADDYDGSDTPFVATFFSDSVTFYLECLNPGLCCFLS